MVYTLLSLEKTIARPYSILYCRCIYVLTEDLKIKFLVDFLGKWNISKILSCSFVLLYFMIYCAIFQVSNLNLIILPPLGGAFVRLGGVIKN